MCIKILPIGLDSSNIKIFISVLVYYLDKSICETINTSMRVFYRPNFQKIIGFWDKTEKLNQQKSIPKVPIITLKNLENIQLDTRTIKLPIIFAWTLLTGILEKFL